MTHLTTDNARRNFTGTIRRVSREHERIVLRQRGKDVIAMVPMEDLKLIRKLEDRLDLSDARKALKAVGSISLEDLKAELGL